jgi:hypothetical protein
VNPRRAYITGPWVRGFRCGGLKCPCSANEAWTDVVGGLWSSIRSFFSLRVMFLFFLFVFPIFVFFVSEKINILLL